VPRVFSAGEAGGERLIFLCGLREAEPAGRSSGVTVGSLCPRGGVSLAFLLVGVADEQGFHLTQKVPGAERFDEQRVRVFASPIFPVPLLSVLMVCAPMFAGWWIGGEQGGRGIVSLAARGADDFQAGLFGFHAQVADDHLVNAGLHAGQGLGGTASSFDFKSVEFENRFEGEQDGEIVVDEKNAAFHRAPLKRS
jgi:hypothetical protein